MALGRETDEGRFETHTHTRGAVLAEPGSSAIEDFCAPQLQGCQELET